MSYPPSGPFHQAINRIPLMKVAYRIGLFIRNYMVEEDKISASTLLRKQNEVFDDFSFSESFEIIMLLFMLSRYDYLEHIDRHKGYHITEKLLNEFPLIDEWIEENARYPELLGELQIEDKGVEIIFRRKTWIDNNRFHSLDLSNLLITDLDKSVFCDFDQLHELYLHNNLLGTLHGDIFQKLPYLEVVDLSSNMITQLPIHIFADNHKLKLLDLTKNGINDNWLSKFRALNRLSHGNIEIKI